MPLTVRLPECCPGGQWRRLRTRRAGPVITLPGGCERERCLTQGAPGACWPGPGSPRVIAAWSQHAAVESDRRASGSGQHRETEGDRGLARVAWLPARRGGGRARSLAAGSARAARLPGAMPASVNSSLDPAYGFHRQAVRSMPPCDSRGARRRTNSGSCELCLIFACGTFRETG
jgi:hypothetical protein